MPFNEDLESISASDIASKDGALRVINDIIDTIKELRDIGAPESEIGARVDEMSAEIKKLKREHAEASFRPTTSDASEKTVSRYLIGEKQIRALSPQVRAMTPKLGEGDTAVLLRGFYDGVRRTWVPGLFDDVKTAESDISEWQRELQIATTDYVLVRTAMRSKGLDNVPIKAAKRVAAVMELAPLSIRSSQGWQDITKIFADSAGIGAEWIIDLGLPEVERDPRLVGRLEGLMRVKPMQAETELLPFLSTNARPRKKVKATSSDPSQFSITEPGTAQRTITASGMVLRLQLDVDATEDAIMNAADFWRAELPEKIAWGYEDCLINGDTAASHQDDLANWNPRSIWADSASLGQGDDHRRTFLGWRALAFDKSSTTDLSGSETYDGMVGTLAELASPHGMSGGTVFVTSLEWLLKKMLAFDEFQGNDKVGMLNSLLSGEVTIIAGKRVLLTDFMDKELNASGLYDDTTKTKTGLLTVNTDRYWVTQRQGNVLRAAEDITRDVVDLVIKNRKGLFSPDATATKNVHFSYNLTA